jgi:TPR repeat protein
MNPMRERVTFMNINARYSKVFSDDKTIAAAALTHQTEQAEQGNLDALRELAIAYSEGAPHVQQDILKAYHFANQGATQQDALCTGILGDIQHRAGEADKALASFKAAYAMGNDEAGINCAMMLLHGEGTSKSPLEGLTLLTQMADDNWRAAITLAEELIQGTHVPKDFRKALTLLEQHESNLSDMNPELRAMASHQMTTCLTQLGVEKSKGGMSAQQLRQQAADLGHRGAKTQIQSEQSSAKHAALRAEWNSISEFEAAGGKWQMFTKTGKLTGIEHCSSKSVHSINGNVSTTTTRWQELTFVESDGHKFEVKVNDSAKPVNGRTFVVLYIGKPGENAGIPFVIYDMEGGKPMRSTTSLESAYGENTSLLLRIGFRLAYLISAALLIAAYFDIPIGFLGYLAIAGMGYGGFLMHKKYRGQLKEALAAAEAFVNKHKAVLVQR